MSLKVIVGNMVWSGTRLLSAWFVMLIYFLVMFQTFQCALTGDRKTVPVTLVWLESKWTSLNTIHFFWFCNVPCQIWWTAVEGTKFGRPIRVYETGSRGSGRDELWITFRSPRLIIEQNQCSLAVIPRGNNFSGHLVSTVREASRDSLIDVCSPSIVTVDGTEWSYQRCSVVKKLLTHSPSQRALWRRTSLSIQSRQEMHRNTAYISSTISTAEQVPWADWTWSFCPDVGRRNYSGRMVYVYQVAL